MPKRKNTKDLDYISDQIKKLKKKLKRARNRSDSSSSSGTDRKNNDKDKDMSGLLDIEDHLPDLDPTNTETLPELTATSSNVEQITNPEPNKEPEDDSLDKDILAILGDDPTNQILYGPEIHKELASRLQHIASVGLSKEAKKEFQKLYLLPSNGTLLGAPTMNPEIKAALTETLALRDKAIETKQKSLASAISCVAAATSSLLGAPNRDTELIKKLMDACKILCDIQHSDSTTRRMFSTSVLKKDVRTQILTTKIDKFLFGETLPDALKSAKAVSKSSAEIKNTYNVNNKKPQPSTSKASNLNQKTPAAPPRKPPATTQKNRQPASHQSQPARQSRTSSQPQKSNSNYRRT